MSRLKVNYLGLELSNPIIIGSSPFTSTIDKISLMAEKGAGAVVLKSIFEEQILNETEYLEGFGTNSKAAGYLESYLGDDYIRKYLGMIADAKKAVDIPVIASINCTHTANWTEYARLIEQAGADALELNIFILPTSVKASSDKIEKQYLDTVAKVVEAVKIPVSVKMGMRFTNLLWMANEMYNRGCKGVVLFNRFFEPDVDIDTLSMVPSNPLSENSELRNSLRSTALCSSAVPMLDISVSTGVHSGGDVVRALLVGARAVQICSALYIHGPEVIGKMKADLLEWMDVNSFETAADVIGHLAYKPGDDNEMYQRAQYMKFFPKQQ